MKSKLIAMKTLLIERTTIGNSESEVIMLHDQENKRSSYVYTNEVNYQDWVIDQATAFRENGYKIFNNTEIRLNHKKSIIRYLITTKETYSPFLTQWFDSENHFNPDIEMIVYDLVECKFTTDGKTWHDIKIDHL